MAWPSQAVRVSTIVNDCRPRTSVHVQLAVISAGFSSFECPSNSVMMRLTGPGVSAIVPVLFDVRVRALAASMPISM